MFSRKRRLEHQLKAPCTRQPIRDVCTLQSETKAVLPHRRMTAFLSVLGLREIPAAPQLLEVLDRVQSGIEVFVRHPRLP